MRIDNKLFLKKYASYIIIIIGIVGVLIGGRISEYIIFQIDSDYAQNIEELKNINVYITRTGERYHKAYHYSDRDYKISLYSALHKGYTPCQVCRPINLTLQQKGYLWIIYIPIRLLFSLMPFYIVYLINRKWL
jgi:hypothetical protein